MPLFLHLYLHFFIALLVGYLTGRYFEKPWLCLLTAIAAGFLIDLDHVLEYFVFFGPNFNLTYFLQGRQFLASEKAYLFFHAWEWVVVLSAIGWLLRKKKVWSVLIITLAIAGLAHLLSDSLINQYPLRFYSFSYRASQNFSVEKLLKPAQLKRNLELKAELGI